MNINDKAPDFTLQGADLKDVNLANSAGKVRVIATIPSLDTPVCHKETKLFNDRVKSLPNVQVLCVSMDLPFALDRWRQAESSGHQLLSKAAVVDPDPEWQIDDREPLRLRAAVANVTHTGAIVPDRHGGVILVRHACRMHQRCHSRGWKPLDPERRPEIAEQHEHPVANEHDGPRREFEIEGGQVDGRHGTSWSADNAEPLTGASGWLQG